jgi:hypothetical protein
VPGSGFLGLGAPKGRKILREEGRGRESANVRRPRATVRIVSEVLEGECKVKGGTPTTLETAGPATWWNTPRSRPRGQGRRRGRQAETTATSGRQTPKISTTPRRARVEGPGKQRRETGRWQHHNGPERATRRTETRHTRFEILRKETRGEGARPPGVRKACFGRPRGHKSRGGRQLSKEASRLLGSLILCRAGVAMAGLDVRVLAPNTDEAIRTASR